MPLSLAMGIILIPFAYAQVLGAIGAWAWLTTLHENGNAMAFWVAFLASRVLFDLIWFVSWRAIEDIAIKLNIFVFDDEIFGNVLPTPNFAAWNKTELAFFTLSILLINFSVADMAIALYTWAPPPYFG